MLKEQELGAPTAGACRKHDISSATFYKFKTKDDEIDELQPDWLVAGIVLDTSGKRERAEYND